MAFLLGKMTGLVMRFAFFTANVYIAILILNYFGAI